MIADEPSKPELSSARAAVRGGFAVRWVQLLLLACAAWAVTYGRFALGPLQETVKADLGLSDNVVALLQGPAQAIPMALAALPIGLYFSRLPRARLIAASVTLSVLATLASSFAPTLGLLFAARCAAGLALGAVMVAAYATVADLFEPAWRGRATMVVAIGEIAGAPGAFALGGALLSMHSEDWRLALLWMSVALVPVALIMGLLREPRRRGQEPTDHNMLEVLRAIWQFRVVLIPLLLARVMVWIADGAVLVWAAPSFSRSYRMDVDDIGAIMGVVLLVSGILGPVLGGPLADLCQRGGGPRRTILALAALALISAPAALFSLAPNGGTAALVLGIFLTLGYAMGTAAMTVGIVVMPVKVRGLFLALSIAIGAVFFIGVAPLAVSLLSTVLGGESMIEEALAGVCVSASLFAALILFSGRTAFPATEHV